MEIRVSKTKQLVIINKRSIRFVNKQLYRVDNNSIDQPFSFFLHYPPYSLSSFSLEGKINPAPTTFRFIFVLTRSPSINSLECKVNPRWENRGYTSELLTRMRHCASSKGERFHQRDSKVHKTCTFYTRKRCLEFTTVG